MAAKFKTFAENTVGYAAEINEYLMRQSVISCANTTERNAIPSPQEGMMVYLRDKDIVQVYDGATWRSYSSFAQGAQRAFVATTENTSSAGYVKLATTTDKVTVTVGDSGMVQLSMQAVVASVATLQAFLGFAVSGATTRSAATNATAGLEGMVMPNTSGSFSSQIVLNTIVTGLTPGTNIFDMM